MKSETAPEIQEKPTHDELREAISIRAYELYQSRGCEDCHDLDDWLQAEREILLCLEVEPAAREESPGLDGTDLIRNVRELETEAEPADVRGRKHKTVH